MTAVAGRRLLACLPAGAIAAGLLLAQCSNGNGGSPQGTGGGSDASVDHGGTTPGADGGLAGDASPGAEAGPGDGGSGEAAPAGFTVGGCPIFPASYAYNQDISQAPLDPDSATYIAALKTNAPVIGLDYPGGEVYNIVPASQAAVPVETSAFYGFDPTDTFFYDVDAGTAPIPSGVQYENMGTPNADHHMMVLQQGSCQLFELYSWNPTSATTGWEALVEWDLAGANNQIPDSLEVGSTTAAGTPLLPGVIWPDEVAAGEIQHAIDIVMPGNAIAKCSYVHPASAGGWTETGTFPYGGRLRLKASFDMSGFTGTQAIVVLKALQKYGMFNTDNSGETRSSFRLGGIGSNQGWVQSDITQLGQLTWDDFDVVDLGTVYTMKGCQ